MTTHPALELTSPMTAEIERKNSAPEMAVPCKASILELQLEVERLRVENRKLRARNVFLEEHCTHRIPEADISPPSSPGRRFCSQLPEIDDMDFDNPFEPPPQKKSLTLPERAPSRQSRRSSSDFGSTDVGCSAAATNLSDWQSACTSASISGATTPAMHSPFAGSGCTYVPVWVPFMNAAPSGFDVSIIPSGIVRDVCAQLEHS